MLLATPTVVLNNVTNLGHDFTPNSLCRLKVLETII